MFGLFFVGTVLAEVPQSAWKAVEIQFHQQSIRDDALVGQYLAQACKEGHKLSCQWNKKREKWDDTTLDTWLMEQCTSKQEPVACTVQGWKQSQLSIAPGIPHKSANDWDGALTTLPSFVKKKPAGA